jgi:hypothetical protein
LWYRLTQQSSGIGRELGSYALQAYTQAKVGLALTSRQAISDTLQTVHWNLTQTL